jgi:hypothetical protein
LTIVNSAKAHLGRVSINRGKSSHNVAVTHCNTSICGRNDDFDFIVFSLVFVAPGLVFVAPGLVFVAPGFDFVAAPSVAP